MIWRILFLFGFIIVPAFLVNDYEQGYTSFHRMLVIGWALTGVLIVVKPVLKKLADRSPNNYDDTLIIAGEKILKILILVSFGVAAAIMMGVQIEPILAGAGIGGLAIALASKDYVSNIVASLSILTTGQLCIGDEVTILRWRGIVHKIGLRNTSLLQGDGTIVMIPNSAFLKSPIENHSGEGVDGQETRPISITMDVHRSADIETLNLFMRGMRTQLGRFAERGYIREDYEVLYEDMSGSNIKVSLTASHDENCIRPVPWVRSRILEELMDYSHRHKLPVPQWTD